MAGQYREKKPWFFKTPGSLKGYLIVTTIISDKIYTRATIIDHSVTVIKPIIKI